jgi:hypothetical protein
MKPMISNINRPISLNSLNAGKNNVAKIPQIDNNNYIQGILLNKSGLKIIGAQVNLLDKDGKLLKSIKTDDTGSFSTEMALPSGTYFLDIKSEGFLFKRGVVNLKGEQKYLFKIFSIN